MSKESYALLTGLFVLVLGAALVGITIWLGHYGEERDTYIVATQGSVSGLNTESTVIYRGVDAGKVAAIGFDPKDPKTILVRIEVNKGMPITHGTYARLRVQGLTGLAQIELNDTGENPTPLITSKQHPARIPLLPSLVDKLSDAGGNILLHADELMASLTDMLNENNRGRIQRILANMETATGQLAGLEERMDEAYAAVREASEDVQGASAKAVKTLSRIDETAGDLRKLTRQIQAFAENADTLTATGKIASEAVMKTTLPRLNALLEDLQLTTAQVKKVSGLLEQNPQALLYGPQASEPGPGEPGYREPK
ncbi:MAG TPA: MlaD family protein [Methylococcaceae bacterium]|nr:MlaD family protein [Methylococcaceae bacterium]